MYATSYEPSTSGPSTKHHLKTLDQFVKILEAKLDLVKADLEVIKRENQARQRLLGDGPNQEILAMKVSGVILYFLILQDAPIAQKALKRQILENGYPPEKFGKGGVYYYITLKRLIRKDKIIREGDEVWIAR